MLLGRSPELEQIGRLVADAREGHGRALLIVGEPGIGKTSVLAEAVALADDLHVIDAEATEAEANLPYALLGETVAPLLKGLPELPERQANAIRAALALEPSPDLAGDRFATCAAFLSLLARAAERKPLLVVVDDAQWLDSPSAECLTYAARRLAEARVALLAASRPSSEGPLLGSNVLERLNLSGLDNEDARALLGASTPEATSSVVESLVEMAAGNPLALRELPAQLSEGQRLGLVPIDHVPVAGAALLEAFESRLAALGADDRAAVVVASAAVGRELAPVVGACRDLGIETSALERAETAGVLIIGEDRLAFSHPLVKAVAYERTTPAERRRAHGALSGHCGPDARAWHLAAATVGPDAEVADLLDGAARRAIARGAHSVAADALQRAAGFSEDAEIRYRRLYGAALAAAIGGAYDRCAALLEPLTEIDDPLLRANIRHTLAVVTMTGGIRVAPDAHTRLRDEAELILPIDPAAAAAMLADAALLAGVFGQLNAGVPAARRAAAVVPDNGSPMIRCRVHALSGIALALAGDGGAARESLDEAGRLLAEIDTLSPGTQSAVLGLHARVCTGQERSLRTEIARLIKMARETDTFGLLPYLLGVSADAAYRVGDWEAAARQSTSVALAEEYGQRGILPFCLAVSGRLRAARGETAQARVELERAIAVAQEVGSVMVVDWGRAALGFLELGIGRAEAAVAELEQVQASAAESGLEDPTFVPWAPDLVEAYIRAGRVADAEGASSALNRRAERSGVALPLAFAARCRGLVEEGGFEAHFDEALTQHGRTEAPFETARTLLAYGSRLHRARRRVDGRKRLRAALEIFEQLGARPWIERTNAELRAAGAIRRDPIADPDELSPQEVRVATAVAEGATNKQVAAELFLSPRTIEFHLGRVYRKLGIHSRAELAGLVAKGALGDSPEKSQRRQA
ncbi:MAG: ATP-binding protein [Solirubrobacterales bacterium]